MIPLSKAFRLCDIREEHVYLRVVGPGQNREYICFWAPRLRELVDMKKIRVLRINPRFQTYGDAFLGMSFEVVGISKEELRRLSHKEKPQR